MVKKIIKLVGKIPLKVKRMDKSSIKAIISIKEANRLLSKYTTVETYPIIDCVINYKPDYDQSMFAFKKDKLLKKNNYTIRFIDIYNTPFLLQLFKNKKKALILAFRSEYNDKKIWEKQKKLLP